MEFKTGSTRVRIVKGDITEQQTDVIVNAANSSLMGGGGVDGAIHQKGGPRILEECRRIRKTEWVNGLPTGEAVITSGGNLKARNVIHTVGPVWHGGKEGEPELLAKAYQNSMKLALSTGSRSIAFPSISTGAYSYPIEKASVVALETVIESIELEDKLKEVVFVLFSDADLRVYREKARQLLRERR